MIGHQAKITLSHFELEYDCIALSWRTRNRLVHIGFSSR